MANITVIYGHPEPDRSLANRAVLEKFSQLAPGADIVTLAKLYPNAVFEIKKSLDLSECRALNSGRHCSQDIHSQ